jgi:hypothetical protein
MYIARYTDAFSYTPSYLSNYQNTSPPLLAVRLAPGGLPFPIWAQLDMPAAPAAFGAHTFLLKYRISVSGE